jgi:hypothetical protein
MADIYVHRQMKECCRAKLRELDGQRRQAGLRGAPLEPLGDKPVDRARSEIPAMSGGQSAAEQTGMQLCARLCQAHAREHENKSETREASFWRDLAGAFQGTQQNPRAEQLKTNAVDAARANPRACNQSVAQVARGYGHTELDGKLANDQVAYMQENWRPVDARTAQDMANRGDLVVAGLSGSGHGHVAVVTPGSGAVAPDGNFYPNVTGGAMNPVAYSEGNKTAGQVWSRSDRGNVQYFAPP